MKTKTQPKTGKIQVEDTRGYFLDTESSITLAAALDDYLNGIRGGMTATTIQTFLRDLKSSFSK